jgi:hypothetical protein
MGVDQHVVPAECRVERGNVPNAAHVRRELVNVLDRVDRRAAVLLLSKVKAQEFVGGTSLELRKLEIDAADPVTLRL